MKNRSVRLGPSGSVAIVLLGLAGWLVGSQALAAGPEPGRRVALVIGNSGYKVGPLRNPKGDARAMAAALGKLGFEVTSHFDVDQRGLKKAIRRFGRTLRTARGGVAFFYYAGHGLQSEGENYMIPLGARIEAEEDIDIEGVRVASLLVQMAKAGSRLNLVVLDACRNNPFASSYRSTTRGLAVSAAPAGTLIAYATAPGRVADDGAGKHSVYTGALLREMSTPGLPLESVFKRTRTAVRQATDGAQVPWESSSVEGEFSFSPSAAASARPVLGTVGAGQPAAAACLDGRAITRDTDGHCCWPGQVWVEGRCVGEPTDCPDEHEVDAEGERCVLPACKAGMDRTRDGIHCCWPGQGWSSTAKVCVGRPRCPEGLKAEDADCWPPTAKSPDPKEQRQLSSNWRACEKLGADPRSEWIDERRSLAQARPGSRWRMPSERYANVLRGERFRSEPLGFPRLAKGEVVIYDGGFGFDYQFYDYDDGSRLEGCSLHVRVRGFEADSAVKGRSVWINALSLQPAD